MKGGKIAITSSFKDGDFLFRRWTAVEHMQVELNPF